MQQQQQQTYFVGRMERAREIDRKESVFVHNTSEQDRHKTNGTITTTTDGEATKKQQNKNEIKFSKRNKLNDDSASFLQKCKSENERHGDEEKKK